MSTPPEPARLVTLRVPAADAELAADVLWRAGTQAVEERPGDTPDEVLLLGDPDPDRVRALAEPGWLLSVDDVDDATWADQWRAWARPSRVGRIVVQLPWVEPLPVGAGDVAVVVDPGRAFGDGRHPSTRLALAALERVVRPGDRVLDVGCGSGVLALVAARLGAARVVGVDVAPAARAATAANAATNDVLVEVGGDVQAVDGEWDVVLANIGAATLRALAPAVVARVAPGGALVLSGLLAAEVDEVVEAYAPLRMESLGRSDEWAAPVLRRRR